MQTGINPKNNHLKIFSAVTLSVLFLDQAVKYFLVDSMLSYSIYKNSNALFGIPYNNELALVFIVATSSYAIHKRKMLLASFDRNIAIYAGLIFGGILGNAFDRMSKGFIVDYLTFLNYFSFNIADLAILAGSSLFFLKIIRK